ncbi:hypothetical protein X737_36535 [Mesorhizobium sp. L48C026A00]|nr:hypothetical protein X737_36535 [Mesorhizobium sp. L48C026A00]
MDDKWSSKCGLTFNPQFNFDNVSAKVVSKLDLADERYFVLMERDA